MTQNLRIRSVPILVGCGRYLAVALSVSTAFPNKRALHLARVAVVGALKADSLNSEPQQGLVRIPYGVSLQNTTRST